MSVLPFLRINSKFRIICNFSKLHSESSTFQEYLGISSYLPNFLGNFGCFVNWLNYLINLDDFFFLKLNLTIFGNKSGRTFEFFPGTFETRNSSRKPRNAWSNKMAALKNVSFFYY